MNESGVESSFNVQRMVQRLFESEERSHTVCTLLKGKEVPFALSNSLIRKLFLGDGCIREQGNCCCIRNPIYRVVLEKNFKIRGGTFSSTHIEIADEVELQIKKVLAGPSLANYEGVICVRALGDDIPVPLADKRLFSVTPGRRLKLVVSFEPSVEFNDCTIAEAVSIRDGEDRSESSFQLELESDMLEFRPRTASIGVKAGEPSKSIEFSTLLPGDVGSYLVWVQVFQQNRLVQTAEVHIMSEYERGSGGSYAATLQKVSDKSKAQRGVFVSYSHKDKKWLERLQTHLRPLIREGAIAVWADTDIGSGERWRDKIEKALAESGVAVLLVSANFLASDFIALNELPPLLRAAREKGLTILWVVVSHCLWKETELVEYKAANDPSRPLDGMSTAERAKSLVEISEKIRDASRRKPESE